MSTDKNNKSFVSRVLSAHAAMAVSVCAILYILCFTGTMLVFKEEIELWEQVGEPIVMDISPSAAQKAVEAGFETAVKKEHLYILMPSNRTQRVLVGTDEGEIFADADGNIAGPVSMPWATFVNDLHYYLTLPKSFGMTVVAIFGVFLFAIIMSGFLAHPNIIKDAFAFRRTKSEQIKQVDLHNRLSVWTAPFTIAVTLTGTMIGLATITAIAVGLIKYDGHFEAVFEPIFGEHLPEDETAAPVANIERAIHYMNENYADKPIVYVLIHEPGTKGQFVQVYAEHTRRLIYAEKYNFNGEGEFIGTVGSADGHLGQQMADSMYKVHFGYFGGYPVKVAYVLFGIAMLYIIHSGTKIYFLKRRAKGKGSLPLEGAWKGVIWGTPSMLIFILLLSQILPLINPYMVAIYWVGLIGICFYMSVFQSRKHSSLIAEEAN